MLYDEGKWVLAVSSVEDYLFYLTEEKPSGKIVGSDVRSVLPTSEIEGCSYELTFSYSNGKEAVVSGWITLPSGTKYTFDNLKVFVEE